MSARQSLYFARPYQTEIRSEPIPTPAPDEVLVKTVTSAISAGTEMLFYRGQVPAGMSVDASIAAMDAAVSYPLTYGYCSAGEIIEVGGEVDPAWHGRRIFAFHPHTSHFVASPATLVPIPDDLSYEQAVLLPNMETAVNFVMDARPVVGERVLVFGLGVVGLLTLHLLRQFPLGDLGAIDAYAKRRQLAMQWGVSSVYGPADVGQLHDFDPDLILEVSSNPVALASAIELAGYGTRIIVGSWYGDKLAHLPLGGTFHRNRVQLVSSQVSTVDGSFGNRWDKARRLQTAWQQLANVQTGQLITHRLPLSAAADAYRLLDQQPDQAVQVLFSY